LKRVLLYSLAIGAPRSCFQMWLRRGRLCDVVVLLRSRGLTSQALKYRHSQNNCVRWKCRTRGDSRRSCTHQALRILSLFLHCVLRDYTQLTTMAICLGCVLFREGDPNYCRCGKCRTSRGEKSSRVVCTPHTRNMLDRCDP
jgi:hypothetical protein